MRQERVQDTQKREIEAIQKFEDDLFEKLDFDDEQGDEIEGFFDDFIDHLQAPKEDQRADARARAEEIRGLVQDLRDAQRDGDQERVADLRQQLSELRRDSRGAFGGVDRLLSEIREVLYEDQLKDYDVMARQFRESLRQPERGDAGIRRIQRAIRMINITPEQRDTLRDIVVEALRDVREQGPGNRDFSQIEANLHDDIVAELDPDQVDAFENALRQLERAEAAERGTAPDRQHQRSGASPEGQATPSTEPQSDTGAADPGAGLSPEEQREQAGDEEVPE